MLLLNLKKVTAIYFMVERREDHGYFVSYNLFPLSFRPQRREICNATDSKQLDHPMSPGHVDRRVCVSQNG